MILYIYNGTVGSVLIHVFLLLVDLPDGDVAVYVLLAFLNHQHPEGHSEWGCWMAGRGREQCGIL